jgi:hypothetical protein
MRTCVVVSASSLFLLSSSLHVPFLNFEEFNRMLQYSIIIMTNFTNNWCMLKISFKIYIFYLKPFLILRIFNEQKEQ